MNIVITTIIEMLIQAEDQIIKVQIENANKAQFTVRDLMTGEQKTFDCSTQEIGAVLALLCCDSFDDELTQQLYAIIDRNQLFANTPINLRPIP